MLNYRWYLFIVSDANDQVMMNKYSVVGTYTNVRLEKIYKNIKKQRQTKQNNTASFWYELSI